MADPTSTPLPAYITPLGRSPKPRMYLVERLSDDELRRLEEESTSLPPERDIELATLEPDVALGMREAAPANDSAAGSLKILLFVGNSHLSRRMLRTARDLVTRIGPERATLRVVDVADESAIDEVAEHRVTFTPTLILDTNEVRTRVVGAASLHSLAELLPDFADCLDEE